MCYFVKSPINVVNIEEEEYDEVFWDDDDDDDDGQENDEEGLESDEESSIENGYRSEEEEDEGEDELSDERSFYMLLNKDFQSNENDTESLRSISDLYNHLFCLNAFGNDIFEVKEIELENYELINGNMNLERIQWNPFLDVTANLLGSSNNFDDENVDQGDEDKQDRQDDEDKENKDDEEEKEDDEDNENNEDNEDISYMLKEFQKFYEIYQIKCLLDEMKGKIIDDDNEGIEGDEKEHDEDDHNEDSEDDSTPLKTMEAMAKLIATLRN